MTTPMSPCSATPSPRASAVSRTVVEVTVLLRIECESADAAIVFDVVDDVLDNGTFQDAINDHHASDWNAVAGAQPMRVVSALSSATTDPTRS